MSDDEPPELGDVMQFPDEQRDDEYRWIVLFEDDYENVAIDVDGNVGVKVDITQTGELMRLAAESLAALSHRDAVGDDVLRDMAERLEQEVDPDA
ncbi:hypothetical protein KM295_14310 [Natronomonas sp. F2-12]|uniref:Uncharacterized protein n=1 Tax=Natronomonas aquatica TaxID=2841590 RepID=A0A9R1CW09_9EURY|nr:hypothetical protein [Natronomonas aquatica]MCQ4334629.1 hypothetical protein [Natronomonas aquatica]